jgi:hypothetical protein
MLRFVFRGNHYQVYLFNLNTIDLIGNYNFLSLKTKSFKNKKEKYKMK